MVEDETLLSLALEAMLEEWGYEQVGSAPSGAEAVRLARETAPDVILMDVNLVGPMDGITAAAEIRAFSGARFVFMTAYSVEDLASRSGLADAPVLHKPFPPHRLERLLSELSQDL